MTGSVFYHMMNGYDKAWRKYHKVEKIDALVSITLEQYKGIPKEMNDGSWVEHGDWLIMLHFNRECFQTPGTSPREYARAALHFRKLIISSFSELAKRVAHEPRFKQVKALHGISWLPTHGEKVGFQIEKVPDSFVNRCRAVYLKMLLKAFFPVLAARENKNLEPHAYWMTRNNLFKYFSEDGIVHAGRSIKPRPKIDQAEEFTEIARYSRASL